MATRDSLLGALKSAGEAEQVKLLSRVPPTLSMKDGVGILSFEAISLSTFEAGKKMPCRYRWEGTHLRFELSDHSLAYIKRTWPNVIILKPAVTAKSKPAPEPAPIQGQMSWRPRLPRLEWQQRAFDHGATKPAFAYLADMGTGKSKAAVDDAAFHFARGELDRVLVISPNGVDEQWVDKVLPEHWPLALGIKCANVDAGDSYQKRGVMHKKRPDWLANPAPSPDECLWLSVNIDNLNVIEEKQGGRKRIYLDDWGEELEAFLKGGPAMIILDESHKVKNPAARRSKAVKKLGRSAAFRRILTGTPLAKGVEDYFSQFQFLDPSIIGVWTFAGFKQQFCVMGGFNGKVITGYRDTEELHSRIADYSIIVRKDDVLDLEPKVFQERLCELTPVQRRHINEIKTQLMTELEDGSVITTERVVQRMLRIQQVTQGFLPREDGSFETIATNRLTPVDDLLEQAEGQVVIWARFQEDITRLMNHLGPDQCLRYDGLREKGKEAIAAQKRLWRAPNSPYRYFVGNPAAGGTGLDWINGPSTVIYYSNSFNSLDRWQSEDRTHRMGTRGTVNYYDIICKGSLDRALLRNLKRKRDVSDMSLTELRELLAEFFG